MRSVLLYLLGVKLYKFECKYIKPRTEIALARLFFYRNIETGIEATGVTDQCQRTEERITCKQYITIVTLCRVTLYLTVHVLYMQCGSRTLGRINSDDT